MLVYILSTAALLYLGFKVITKLPQRAEEVEISEEEYEWYFEKGNENE